MKKIKVGVLGAGGRMGREVAGILSQQKNLVAHLAVEGKGEASGFSKAIKKITAKDSATLDVWIDFSTPEALENLLKIAVETKTPVVSGTTGLSVAQKELLKKASQKIPILWASNMSLGVAVLNQAIQLYSQLKGFDFQIEEVHHSRKKDRPSGTAITLQETLMKATKAKIPEPIAIRGGGVYGIHKAWALSEEEVLVFEHQALNRAVFARGAVQAAEWLSGQKPGLYEIHDLLLHQGPRKAR